MTAGRVLWPDEGKRLELPIPGAAMVFKAWGDRPAGNHDVAEFIFDPGFPGPRPHVHRAHEEFFFVLEGELEFLVGDRALRLGPGAASHVPPGVIHDFRNSGDIRTRCLFISSPGGLHRYFEDMVALGAEGRFSDSALRQLRLKYDTDEVELAWHA